MKNRFNLLAHCKALRDKCAALFCQVQYNSNTPLVVVDSGSDPEFNRGDIQGAIGLGQRVTKKINARFVYVNNSILEDLYPKLASEQDNTKSEQHKLRLAKLFSDIGHPDFLFGRDTHKSHVPQSAKTGGLIINTINEDIPLLLPRWQYSRWYAPHLLTPDVLQHEGYLFGQEYSELKRPLVGWLGTGDGYSVIDKDNSVVARLVKNMPEGTLFICGGRRTYTSHIENLTAAVRASNPNIDIVSFDFRHHYNNHGHQQFYNPYIGLLDQADHLIVGGDDSYSTVSEALATGKTAHVICTHTRSGPLSGTGRRIRWIEYDDELPELKTKKHTRIDMGDKIAKRIINLHAKGCKVSDPRSRKKKRHQYDVV